MIFALNFTNCLHLAHGYRSIVYADSGLAKTVLIEDQPEYHPLKEFLEKIHTLLVPPGGANVLMSVS